MNSNATKEDIKKVNATLLKQFFEPTNNYHNQDRGPDSRIESNGSTWQTR